MYTDNDNGFYFGDTNMDFQQFETNDAINNLIRAIETEKPSEEVYTATKLSDSYTTNYCHPQPQDDTKSKDFSRPPESSNLKGKRKHCEQDGSNAVLKKTKKEHHEKKQVKDPVTSSLKLKIPIPEEMKANKESRDRPPSTPTNQGYTHSVPQSIYELNKQQEAKRKSKTTIENVISGLESCLQILTPGRECLFNLGLLEAKELDDLKEKVNSMKQKLELKAKEYEIEMCLICSDANNPVRVVGHCGHAFSCIKCFSKYVEIVMNKHSGNWICLKCNKTVNFSMLQS